MLNLKFLKLLKFDVSYMREIMFIYIFVNSLDIEPFEINKQSDVFAPVIRKNAFSSLLWDN